LTPSTTERRADVCFVSDARLDSHRGLYWDPRQNFPEGHWSEALETFSSVTIAARVRHVDSDKHFGPLFPSAVRLIEFAYFVGLRQALSRILPLMRSARRCAREANMCVLRGPGILSILVWTWASICRRPYAVEVLGDMEEVFAMSDASLARIARRIAPAIIRRICRGGVATLYVSRALQEKYPPSPATFSTVVSDVRMPRELFRPARVLSSSPQRLVLIHVGNMEKIYKGHDTMIRAVAMCGERGLAVELHLIGEGRMRPAFQHLASELGVDTEVIFEGGIPWGPALFEKLDAAHLFVFPSRTEAIGKALIEAMARGLPVIASRVGGIPELVDEDMLIPASDPKALADAIEILSRDHEMLNARAARSYRNAQRYVDEQLSPLRRQFYEAVRNLSR
jgi:phosphatidylinositol alpha-1,6-mannosyltransferase